MNTIFKYTVKKKIGILLMMLVVLTFCSSSSAVKKEQPDSTIVGTWISTQGGNTKWVFTDSKTKTYYKDNLDNTYTYKISRDSYRCGVDMSDRLDRYPKESILTLTDTQSNEKKCYLVQNISNDTLVLQPFGYASFLVFDKQQ